MGDVRTMDSVDEAGLYLYENVDWYDKDSEYLEWYSCTFSQFMEYCFQKERLGILY